MEENISNTNIQNNSGPKAKISRIIILVIFIFTFLVSAVFGSIFGFIAGGGANILVSKLGGKLGKVFTPSSNQAPQVIQQKLIEEDSAVTGVVEKTSPAVVSIIITKDVPKYKSFFDDPFSGFPFFLNPGDQSQGSGGTEKQQIGGGSGFLVSADGMIITNRHVVDDTQADYTVVTNDGKEHSAKVLARHPSLDIAVIKIDGSGFPTLNLGDSDGLKVGQTVIAIGNSLGEFANSVSKGIVSGLKRNLTAGSGLGQTEQLTNIIQTDAAINPGNSGGPLLDISGNVIGINVAMAQGAQNIGFALPVNQIKKVVETVKSQGKISVPFLGVRYVLVDDQIQKDNNLPFNYGALVLRGTNRTDLAVIPGSPSDKAGIVENDIILEINGQKITQDNQLGDIISKYNVGDTITLKVWDKGTTKDAKVTLEERK
jgi:serine protease Do